jgi:hypothetical protein
MTATSRRQPHISNLPSGGLGFVRPEFDAKTASRGRRSLIVAAPLCAPTEAETLSP